MANGDRRVSTKDSVDGMAPELWVVEELANHVAAILATI
jgi:hypothetical protein